MFSNSDSNSQQNIQVFDAFISFLLTSKHQIKKLPRIACLYLSHIYLSTDKKQKSQQGKLLLMGGPLGGRFSLRMSDCSDSDAVKEAERF